MSSFQLLVGLQSKKPDESSLKLVHASISLAVVAVSVFFGLVDRIMPAKKV